MTAPVAPVRRIEGNAPAAERPDYRRPEYEAQDATRRLSRAMMEGTQGVRALGTAALPKWPAEEPAFYRLRARIAQVTRYYQRTIRAMTGMIAGTPPTLAEDTDARVRRDWEDLDRKGTHGDVFVREFVEDALVGGFAAILVDAPPVPDGLRLTLQNEQRMGLRPYWVRLSAEQLLSWQVEAPDWPRIMADYLAGLLTDADVGRLSTAHVLRQVVIYEPTDVEEGAFGVARRDRYRVLRLTDAGVVFTVWEHVPATSDGTGEHFRVLTEGAMLGARRQPLRAIPLAIAYPQKPTAPFVCEPVLFGVAELNLDHYQLTADRRYLIKHTHSPTLYLFGVEPDRDANGQDQPIRVGPNSVIRSRNADAKAGYVTAPADALAASKEERDDVVQQIAALGMSFIARDRQRSTETATGRTLDLEAEHATHVSVARAIQDAIEQALVFHVAHYDAAPPSVEMHPAVPAPDVDPQLANVLWQAVVAGRLDVETWLAFLKTGRLPEEVDLAAVTARLLAEAAADDTVEGIEAQEREVAGDAADDAMREAA